MGALAPTPRFQFFFSVKRRTCSADTKEFLEKIVAEASIPVSQMKIVLDNHSAHHSALVTSWATSVGLSLVFLPPYSSPLNQGKHLLRVLTAFASGTSMGTAET